MCSSTLYVHRLEIYKQCSFFIHIVYTTTVFLNPYVFIIGMKVNTSQLNIKMTPDLRMKIHSAATARNLSDSGFVRLAVFEYLDEANDNEA